MTFTITEWFNCDEKSLVLSQLNSGNTYVFVQNMHNFGAAWIFDFGSIQRPYSNSNLWKQKKNIQKLSKLPIDKNICKSFDKIDPKAKAFYFHIDKAERIAHCIKSCKTAKQRIFAREQTFTYHQVMRAFLPFFLICHDDFSGYLIDIWRKIWRARQLQASHNRSNVPSVFETVQHPGIRFFFRQVHELSNKIS